MQTRVARWATAAVVASALSSMGCDRLQRHESGGGPGTTVRRDLPYPSRAPIVGDESLVHAIDTDMEMRIVDRLELDRWLTERNISIDILDGVIVIAGEVWSPEERDRVGDLVRSVAGLIDVANRLDVRPPG